MLADVHALLDSPRLHHVGIITPSEEQASRQMAKLGLTEAFRGYVQRWDVLCIFSQANGGSPIEFVIPYSGPLKSFNSGVGGLHHIALTVEDLRVTMEHLTGKGVKMLEEEPVKGAGAFLCNFLHPMFTRGFTVELVQEL